jgi:hypothetical protein
MEEMNVNGVSGGVILGDSNSAGGERDLRVLRRRGAGGDSLRGGGGGGGGAQGAGGSAGLAAEEEEEGEGERVRGLAANGSTVLSASAIATGGSSGSGDSIPHTVVVHERLVGTTLVVMFDGRILPSHTRAVSSGPASASPGGGAPGAASSRGREGAAAGADVSHREGMRGGGGAGGVAEGEGGGGEPTPTRIQQQQQQQPQQTELVFFTPSSHQNGGGEPVGLAWVVAILATDPGGGGGASGSGRPALPGSGNPNPNTSWTNTAAPPGAPSHRAARYVDSQQPADSGGSLECEMVRVGAAVVGLYTLNPVYPWLESAW